MVGKERSEIIIKIKDFSGRGQVEKKLGFGDPSF